MKLILKLLHCVKVYVDFCICDLFEYLICRQTVGIARPST